LSSYWQFYDFSLQQKLQNISGNQAATWQQKMAAEVVNLMVTPKAAAKLKLQYPSD
jgi:hypothetical protein